MTPLMSVVQSKVRAAIPTPEVAVTAASPRGMFLQLVRYTCPHGREAALYGRWLGATGWTTDRAGNYHREVGDGTSRTLFGAHLDTVGGEVRRVKYRLEDEWIATRGKTILGADDKAGVAILLSLIQSGVPGHYALFVGEERGGIGSGAVVGDPFYGRFSRMICFDRAGYGDVITWQSGGPCCSDEFAQALADRLNVFWTEPLYAPCDRGSYTDSAEFTAVIPECTNLSVGYFAAHSHAERQNAWFLEWLCQLLPTIDWESLPVKRDPRAGWRSTWETDSLLMSSWWDAERADYRKALLAAVAADDRLRDLADTVGLRCLAVEDLEYLLEHEALPPDLRDAWDSGTEQPAQERRCALCGDAVSEWEALFCYGEPRVACSAAHLREYEGVVNGG